MSLFVIADTHLSFGTNKPMDIFGGWQNFEERLSDNWKRIITDDDTVVIPGDISWGMDLDESYEDFRFLHELPGRKILMKGNHDYWWATKTKSENFFKEKGLDSLSILFNNAYEVGDFAVCGTRGWVQDCCKDEDKKVLAREAGRLRMSALEARKTGKEPIAFLHYPPVDGTGEWCKEIFDVLKEMEIRRVYYGHLHGISCNNAFNGEKDGIHMSLISADYLKFCPKLAEKY
ncbi:MAG: metallophosphoesterase [Clostridia bacterium]|nr:metallophosphoesterase [Clostridia bacterium]